jgi:hypothetical protein
MWTLTIFAKVRGVYFGNHRQSLANSQNNFVYIEGWLPPVKKTE